MHVKGMVKQFAVVRSVRRSLLVTQCASTWFFWGGPWFEPEVERLNVGDVFLFRSASPTLAVGQFQVKKMAFYAMCTGIKRTR